MDFYFIRTPLRTIIFSIDTVRYMNYANEAFRLFLRLFLRSKSAIQSQSCPYISKDQKYAFLFIYRVLFSQDIGTSCVQMV